MKYRFNSLITDKVKIIQPQLSEREFNLIYNTIQSVCFDYKWKINHSLQLELSHRDVKELRKRYIQFSSLVCKLHDIKTGFEWRKWFYGKS